MQTTWSNSHIFSKYEEQDDTSFHALNTERYEEMQSPLMYVKGYLFAMHIAWRGWLFKHSEPHLE